MILSITNLLLGLLLLAVPVYAIYTYDRLTLKKSALAVVRMLVQISVMGGCLWAVYHFNSIWINLLWLMVLVLAAAFLMVSRTCIRSRILFLPAFLGMLVSVLVVSCYVLFAILRPEHPMSARWFVPITGVLTAHVLTTGLYAIRTYFDSLSQDSQPYYTLLGNGASRMKALAPYITRALRSMTTPAVAYLSAMGLFVMPMLLSGLLGGGMPPLEAIALFVLLILASMASSVLSVGLTIWLSCRYTFDKQGRILPVFTPKA